MLTHTISLFGAPIGCRVGGGFSIKLARIFQESSAATTNMTVLPGVLGCSFGRLRTSSPCDVLFKYASASILDLGFFTTIDYTELNSSDFTIRSLVLTSFSVNFQSAFRIPNSTIVDRVARPSSRSRYTDF